jgi:VanZ family protein
MGADRTSGPLRLIYEAIFGPVRAAQWEIIHGLVRKSGHFLGYGAIALAWFRAWWMTLSHKRFIQNAALAFLGTAAMASVDEFHQTLLHNRTGSPRDVLLDCCGASAMLLTAYLLMLLYGRRKQTHAASALIQPEQE